MHATILKNILSDILLSKDDNSFYYGEEKWTIKMNPDIKLLAQDLLERRHKYTVIQFSAIFPTIQDIPKALRLIMESRVDTLGNNQNSV